MWSKTAEVALLVSPEEAEILIPICRTAPKQLVHLLTYAAATTQKMLHFSDLDFYATPALPAGWKAPMWLKVQLGIFAGRLYFPYHELQPIRALLEIQDDQMRDVLVTDQDAVQLEDESSSDSNAASADHESRDVRHPHEFKEAHNAKMNATKVLRFLHAWLATKSRGQDFTHTPMGYICARKPLTHDHAFFRTIDENEALRKQTRNAAVDEEEDTKAAQTEEHDNASDLADEDVDERQRLTEEELKQSEESAARDADDTESEDSRNDDDEDETDSAGFMFDE